MRIVPALCCALQMLEADRNTILRRCSVLAQDLRIVDPKLSYPSTILGRDRAVVVNLQPMKVGDHGLVPAGSAASYVVVPSQSHLE